MFVLKLDAYDKIIIHFQGLFYSLQKSATRRRKYFSV